MSITPIEPITRATYNLGINASQLGIGRHADKFSIKNVYIDVDDTHIKVVPFDFTDDVDDNGSVLALPATTIGSAYQIQFYAAGKMLLSAYFEMPERDCFLAELKLHTAMPAREHYPEGAPGKSAYQSAIDTGVFEGTEEQWAQWQKPTINDVDLLADIKVINDITTLPAGVTVPRRIGSDVYTLSTFNDRLADVDKVLTQTGGTVDIGGVPVKTIKQAADDALNIATAPIYDFIDAGKDAVIERPLGAPFKSLNHYLEYLDAIKSVFTQPSGSVTVNGVSVTALQQSNTDINSSLSTAVSASLNESSAATERANNAADVVDNLVVGKVRAQDVSTTGATGYERKLNTKLQEITSPFDFGAIGDGTHHPVSQWTVLGSAVYFPNLAAIQQTYPHVESLTDSIDWVALQAFFNYCKANVVTNANVGGNYSTNKELNYVQGHGAKTKRISGIAKIVATADMHHVVRIAGSHLMLDGFDLSTTQPNVYFGLFVGGYLDSVSTINTTVNSVKASGFKENGVHLNQNTMFCYIGNVRGQNCGKRTNFKTTVAEQITSTSRTKLNVTELPRTRFQPDPLSSQDFPLQPVYVSLNNAAYRVDEVDEVNKTITVYPTYKPTAEQEIDPMYQVGAEYLAGGCFYHAGNNSGCVEVGTVSAILCATGVFEGSLYSGTYHNIITEYCGAGLVVGQNSSDPAMVLNIGRIYFEANKIDYIQSGKYMAQKSINMCNTVNINKAKIFYLNGSLLEAGSELAIGTHTYEQIEQPAYRLVGGEALFLYELTQSHGGVLQVYQQNSMRDQLTFDFSIDAEIYRLIGSRSAVIQVHTVHKNAPVEIRLPSGCIIKGTSSNVLKLTGLYKNPIIYINMENLNSVSVVVTGEVITPPPTSTVGATTSRPTTPSVGTQFFDTTLNKPIYYVGTQWVDALGVAV